jgi:hypothetical protein
VAREPKLERNPRYVEARVGEHLQSASKAKLGLKCVQCETGLLAEHAAEMEFRYRKPAGKVGQRNALRHRARECCASALDEVAMRFTSPDMPLRWTLSIRTPDHSRHQLDDRLLGLERIDEPALNSRKQYSLAEIESAVDRGVRFPERSFGFIL